MSNAFKETETNKLFTHYSRADVCFDFSDVLELYPITRRNRVNELIAFLRFRRN